MQTPNKLLSIFSTVEDPRSHINQLHKLEDILVIGIISVICGADTWKNMTAYARSKVDFLSTFLELPNGIPSQDTFKRVFTAIEPSQFENCFVKWVRELARLNSKEVVAIDGKTIRGAKKHGKKSPIHMVSAWASEQNLVL